METAFLVAGLGNPGAQYAHTRHNAGFLVVERFGEKLGASWNEDRKFRSKMARVEVGERKVFLCEPQTYMNVSGEAIAPLAEYYKIALDRLLVVMDDADLPFGQIRLRASGSSGGHHGLESIEKHLGSREFARLRVGIGRSDRTVREITGHVLGRFSNEEQGLLEKVLERAARQVECFITAGVHKAMNEFNGAVTAPPEKD